MRLRASACRMFIVAVLSTASVRQSICGETANYQNPSGRQSGSISTFRINTSLVLVPVSVTDSAGRAVKNLKLEDFTVMENGRTVALEYLGEPGLTKLEIVLVFDITGSTRPRFNFVQQAATRFLKSLFRPGDAVAIAGIASEPENLLNRTESLDAALDGLNRLKPFGTATAFFDSIIAATRLFQATTGAETRRVMVVLSDGEDNLSTKKLADALREIQMADCVFYSINPGGNSIRLNKVSLRGQQWMEALADQTGGTAFLANNIRDLSDIYGRIAAELQVQYLLSYYSPDPKADGSFHFIEVTVPEQPELRVRARRGYYSRKGPSR
jgi:Ca-activated chloride channel family protein